MPKLRLSVGLFSVMLTVLPASGIAQEMEPKRPIPWFDRFHDQVQDNTQSLAQELDEFLSDREYESQLNRTQISLSLYFDQSSDLGTQFRAKPRIRLKLPNTERALFLDILGAPNSDPSEEDDLGGDLLNELLGQEERRAIQLRTVTEYRGLQFAPSVGVGSEFDEFKVYAGLHASGTKELSPTLSIYGSQRVIAHSNRGWEAITLVRSDWLASETSLVRGQLRLDWREDIGGLRYRPALIFRRLLNNNTVVSFENYFQGSTNFGNPVDSFYTGFRYRQRLYKEWMVGEITPWVGVERVSDYDTIYGIQVRLEMNF